MMTALEARSHCIAVVLNGEPETWGKAQADLAVAQAAKLLQVGKIDASVFAEVVGNVAGNHSAKRQQLQSWGLLASREGDSAEKRAILAEMKRLVENEDKGLEAMAKK